MQSGSQSFSDYDPVIPSGRKPRAQDRSEATAVEGGASESHRAGEQEATTQTNAATWAPVKKDRSFAFTVRGHSFTFVWLFLFSALLYLRPSEFYPSFVTKNITFVVGLVTLVVYLFSQLSLEKTLTARPREVNLLLLLTVAALLSLPLSYSPSDGWVEFTSVFMRCVLIFIVIVNVVRTESRLRALLSLAVVVSCWLSLGAINDFLAGNLTVEGYRVAGRGTGIFGNSNDLALHLVTIAPISISLLFASRGGGRKLFYGGAAALMLGAVLLTYSRGAFLGMLCSLAVLAWKLGRRQRFAVFAIGLVLIVGMVLFAPGNYATRLLSIVIPSLDPVGSSDARRGELIHSIWATVFNPVFGVGMANYVLMSYRSHVTHNAYTQVSAELGIPALVCYVLFIVTPLKRVWRVERETLGFPGRERFFYLSAGLQASLVAYIVSSFFASVAYLWYVYYLVGYALCFSRIYEGVKDEPEIDGRKSVAPYKDSMDSMLTGERDLREAEV
jgi:hypothetical protein